MNAKQVHDSAVVIDGLIIAKWNRALFEDMRRGGLTAANCTVSVWEGFQATIDNIAMVNRLMTENADLVMPVRTTADIAAAKEAGKTGIILGFQNAHAFEDKLGYVEMVAANPDTDPWLPGEGTDVILPTVHLLPEAAHEGIVINLADMRLYYFETPDGPPRSYPIGIGRDGLTTPLGSTRSKSAKT